MNKKMSRNKHSFDRGSLYIAKRRRFGLIFTSFMVAVGTVASIILPIKPAEAATIGGSWQKVETGGDYVCAIGKGELYCRGLNTYGQLGNGTTTNSVNLVKVQGLLAGKTVTDVSASQYTTCAIANGEVYCWGNNWYGYLGNGTYTDSSTPVKVTQDPGLLAGKTVTAISVGDYNACAIANGEAYCWGSDGGGTLGNGSTVDSPVPVKVTQDPGLLAGKTVSDIRVGSDHTCAVAGGEAYCWGDNFYGALGTGSSGGSSSVPLNVGGLLSGKTISAVGSGYGYSCAIADGEAYCWGSDGSEQLGNAPNTNSYSPTKVTQQPGLLAGKTLSSMSAGTDNVCVVSNGDLFCWGGNSSGSLGNGTEVAQPYPVQVQRGADLPVGAFVSQVSMSEYAKGDMGCALADGQIYCWGNNIAGAVGFDGGVIKASGIPLGLSAAAKATLSGKTITAIAGTYNHRCILASGEVYCWGDNSLGQLGNASFTGKASSDPINVSQSGLLAGKTVTAISAGLYHTCALASGEVYCWGYNAQGQLGNGTTTDSSAPVKVTQAVGLLAGKTVDAISSGGSHTCAIAGGEAYCWGYNSSGQLGDSTTTQRNSPVKVTQAVGVLSGKTVTDITAGSDHTCALAGGEAYCWGTGTSGQLGNSTTADSSVPVKVTQAVGLLAGAVVTNLSAGGDQTCAIANSEAYCWGYNAQGQLGDSTTTSRNSPVKVTQAAGLLAGKTVSNISVGEFHVCVIANAEMYCWGNNNYGELGDGTTTSSTTPMNISQASAVLSGKSISIVNSGRTDTCVLAGGNVYCVGDNSYGKLGQIFESHSSAPRIWSYTFPTFAVDNRDLSAFPMPPTISRRPTFTGSAQPGSTIVVTAHSNPVTCTTTADSNGNWSCTLPTDLPPGVHTVTVVVTDTNNNVTTLGPYNVTVSTLSGNLNSPNTGGGMTLDLSLIERIFALVCISLLGIVGLRKGLKA